MLDSILPDCLLDIIIGTKLDYWREVEASPVVIPTSVSDAGGIPSDLVYTCICERLQKLALKDECNFVACICGVGIYVWMSLCMYWYLCESNYGIIEVQ